MANKIYQAHYQIDISGNVKPYSNHLVVEKQDQTAIYFVDSADNTIIKKVDTTTGAVTPITDRDEAINALWYDRTNDYIYGIDSASAHDGHIFHIVLADDSIVNDETVPSGTSVLNDVFKYSGTTYTFFFLIYFHIGPPITTTLGFSAVDENTNWYYYDAGYTADVNAKMSYGLLIGGYFYFISKSTGHNAELWKWEIATNNCTILMDCGANTTLTDSRNLQGISYDNTDILYFILKYTDDNKNYLCTYSIVGDTFTKGSEYNVSLMLDRNTNSSNTPDFFILEKGFSTSLGSDNQALLYQISRTRGALNFLGQITLEASSSIVAITDYFIIIDRTSVVELWKFEDVMGTCIAECNIDAEERTWTSIDLIWINQGAEYQDPPERDQFIQVFGRYSSYTLGAPYYADNTLIAEGLVRTFNLDVEQEVRVESLAQEELNFAPNITSYTNYTGKTSGAVITQLLLDYCKTITAGTIVNGSITWTCPADWSVAGDKSIEVILNELADAEHFSWRLRPNCKLDFDAGTVDSQMNFASTDSYENQEARLLSQQINQIIVYGGFVNGSQIGPYYANDTNHQLLYGNIVKWSKTYSGIFDATALQTIADNKLLIQGAKPLVFWTERYCTDWGFVQVGETVDIGAGVKVAPNSTQTLTAGAYIVNRNKFDAKNNISEIKISDGMLFLEEGSETLSEQNSELIQQLADRVETKLTSDNISDTAYNATTWDNVTTIAPSKNAIRDKIEAMISDTAFSASWDSVTTIAPSKNTVYDILYRIRVPIPIYPSDGAVIGTVYSGNRVIVLNAIGETVVCQFYCDDSVDCDYDIVFTLTYFCTSTDATLDGQEHVGANKTNNTETYDCDNIAAASGRDLNVTANVLNKFTYTFAAANIDNGDLLLYTWELRETKVISFLSATVDYYRR